MKRYDACLLLIFSVTLFAGSSIKPLRAESDTLSLLGWERSIKIADIQREELVAVPLDSEVYEVTQDGLADLRIVDEQGQPVPYLLRKKSEQKGKTVRQVWQARDLTLKPGLEDGLDIRLNLKEDDPHPDGLRIVTPLHNFEQRVQLFSIDANGEETLVVEDGLIFDYAKYIDVRKTDIAIPKTDAREFRIVITVPTVEQESQLLELTRHIQDEKTGSKTERLKIDRRPFRIDQLEFWSEKVVVSSQTSKTRDYNLADFKISQDSVLKQTVIDIFTRREPLTAFTINTSSRNFSRSVEVLEFVEVIDHKGPLSSSTASFKSIANSTLTRIDFRELQEEHLTVAFPSTRQVHYQIRIDNKDNAPLEIESVTAQGQIDELVFLATPKGKYQLLYGSETAEPARYDVAALKLATRNPPPDNNEPVEATLGGPVKRSLTIPAKPFDLKFILNNPLIIGSIAVILTMLLGWLLYKASQQIEKDHGSDST